MTFYDRITEFAGLPVVLFPADPELDPPVPDTGVGSVAWRIDCNDEGEYFEKDFAELLDTFLERVDSTQVRALITSLWTEYVDWDHNPVAEDLAAVADRLPVLRSLFIGELVDGQAQPSWTYQKPVTPLLEAFPLLEELWVRGRAPEPNADPRIVAGESAGDTGDSVYELIAAGTKHAALRKLVFQSGGLARETVRALAECEFPELTHLEIYLGEPNYGGDADVEDLAPFLDGSRFPKLRYLGLKDSVFQDAIAAAVAQAPIVAQLEVLDLSLGALGDDGAAALLAGQPLGHLRKLDLSHHFLSDEMEKRLRQAWPGVDVELAGRQRDGRRGRYIAIAE